MGTSARCQIRLTTKKKRTYVATEKLEFLWPEERIKESKSIGVWSCRHPYVATQHDWSSEAGGFGRRAGLGAMMEQTREFQPKLATRGSPCLDDDVRSIFLRAAACLDDASVQPAVVPLALIIA